MKSAVPDANHMMCDILQLIFIIYCDTMKTTEDTVALLER